jgi:hypothetical protein
LSAFLAGYATRAMMWVSVNRAQHGVAHAAQSLEHTAREAASTQPEAAAVIAEAARGLAQLQESLTPAAREYQVWQLMLGLDRGWFALATAVILIAYNILRAWLTHDVGAMRDEADRSGFAPYWRDYKRAWYAHTYVMRWLVLLALVSFLWHAWGWLSAPVWLPR